MASVHAYPSRTPRLIDNFILAANAGVLVVAVLCALPLLFNGFLDGPGFGGIIAYMTSMLFIALGVSVIAIITDILYLRAHPHGWKKAVGIISLVIYSAAITIFTISLLISILSH